MKLKLNLLANLTALKALTESWVNVSRDGRAVRNIPNKITMIRIMVMMKMTRIMIMMKMTRMMMMMKMTRMMMMMKMTRMMMMILMIWRCDIMRGDESYERNKMDGDEIKGEERR